MDFDEDYYQFNLQSSDRPALQFYYRLWKRYCQLGAVLEFGCGVGHLAKRLSTSCKTYGLEINPYALRQVAMNAPKVEIIDSLNCIVDGTLNSIVSLHVLEHIEDAELILIGERFSRILKPHGRILIVVPDAGGIASLIKGINWLGLKDPTHINLKSATQWQEFFKTYWGMNVVKMGADGYYDFPYGNTFYDRTIGNLGMIIRTGLQFLRGIIILKSGDGEACIFLLEKI